MARREQASGVDRLIVLGASAGGVEALTRVAKGLPVDLPAGIVAVLHFPNDATSHLPEILERAGPLRALQASDGAALRPGEFVVAPPNRHVIVSAGRVWLNEGPRENGVRPAADPLFRSAARSFGERAIGVVLSGTLDDGAAGLAAIAAAGGTTVVQDPRDAPASGMPRAALETARVDHVAPVDEIGPLLGALVANDPPTRTARAVEEPVERDLGPTDLGCPACGGVLRTIDDGTATRFRCRVGHSYSPETLITAQDRTLEEAMWAALRGLEDQASAAERIAENLRQRGLTRVALRFDDRQTEAAKRASVVRSAIEQVGLSSAIEPAGDGESEAAGGREALA